MALTKPTWWDSVKAIFDGSGVPEYVWSTIAYQETKWNPNSKGDYWKGGQYVSPKTAGAVPKSFGLFQLQTINGLGKGHDPNDLLNPVYNANIAVKPIAAQYKAAAAKGLTGYDAVKYVASHSGFPLMTGNLPTYYEYGIDLKDDGNGGLIESYKKVTGGTATGQEIKLHNPAQIFGTSTTETLANDPRPIMQTLTGLNKLENDSSLLGTGGKLGMTLALAALGLLMIGFGLQAVIGKETISNMAESVTGMAKKVITKGVVK